MNTANRRVERGNFCQCEGVHGTGMHSSILERKIVLELQVVFNEVAFFACTVDADDAGRGRGCEER